MPGSKPHRRCECYAANDGHPSDATPREDGTGGYQGDAHCQNTGRLRTLYRVDMDDKTGSRMCAHCAADAFESGLFKG